MEDFLARVGEGIRDRSGAVFYSGRSAFSRPSAIYLLGLNPGGDPDRQAAETVGQSINEALTRPQADWSAYVDESWNGRPAGSTKMQPRIQHMMRELGLDPRKVPASNVVFVRSRRERDLADEKAELLRACWPVHQAVIDKLMVRAVICLGGTAGRWVRDQVDANRWIDSFREDNDRKWTSEAHENAAGLAVITVTHPSIAAWNTPSADPTPMVARILARGT